MDSTEQFLREAARSRAAVSNVVRHLQYPSAHRLTHRIELILEKTPDTNLALQ